MVAVRIHIFSTRWRWEYVWQLDIHGLQNKTSWRDAGLWSSHKKRAVKCFKCMCLAFVHIRSYDVNTTRHWGPVVDMQTSANLPCHAMPIEHIPKPSSYITYPNRIWFRYVDLHGHADMHDLAYWFGNMSLKCFTVADLTTTIIWGHRLGSLRISIKWGFVSVWRMSLPVNVWKGELSLWIPTLQWNQPSTNLAQDNGWTEIFKWFYWQNWQTERRKIKELTLRAYISN